MLSKPDLIRHLETKRLGIDPAPSEDQIAQVSIDLHLGRKLTRPRREDLGYLPAIHVDPGVWRSSDLWEHVEQDVYRLDPGGFVLANTVERVRIPNDLVGLVEGRSSVARVGITVHVTAPKIDPGFDAHITLEMTNFGRVPVDLRAGIDAPAQLMLLRLSTPLDESQLYGTGPRDHFQHQTDPIPRGRG